MLNENATQPAPLGHPAPHAASVEEIADQLDTRLHRGLTGQEARARLARFGPNELVELPKAGWVRLLLGQFNNFLVILLLVAAVVSLLLGEVLDALAIFAIVILNALLGVVQESRAERALAALQKLAVPNAQVIRDGRQGAIPARELVSGDIVLLEAGNYVPADMRLMESVNLRIEEASLTGESVAVAKDARVVLDREIPLGDRRNSAFMGTLVSYGRGMGLVTGTGMRTQIGLIAQMIQTYEEEPTPLQIKLDELGKTLGMATLAICGIILVIGIFRDTPWSVALTQGAYAYLRSAERDLVNLFMTAVSLAIAAVPEGLPAVVTICLALGMQRMVRRHVLLRKLPAVETLGSATVICSDKTGTLTQNEMTVVKGWAGGRTFEISGRGYDPHGSFFEAGHPFDPRQDEGMLLMLLGAQLCNDARLERSGEEQGQTTWRMVGDPTEGAMAVAAAKAGLERGELQRALPRVLEVPFDSERKRMATVHEVLSPRVLPPGQLADPMPYLVFVKGAPGLVLERCERVCLGGETRVLDAAKREEVLAAADRMARDALRILGVAWRPLNAMPSLTSADEVEKDLVFLGLLGMIDPPRAEVAQAVQVARKAGLKTVMITGDAKETALAVARQIGLLRPKGRVLTGPELDGLSDQALAEIANEVDAFARVSPMHKVKIVDALKERGHVVAMTGDGVNDAPALQRANIGIAMGITGTDVSRETADMVLTDDNYASIVAAIEEGRIIYSNIRKFVFYLISCNVGEILVVFLSMLAGLPLPLTPIQLLWLNLVTDGAPALALGLEKGDPDVMKVPPRPTQEPVINGEMQVGVLVQAVVMTSAVLLAFMWGLRRFPGDLAAAQTVTFATLIMSELLRAYTARSERYSLFAMGPFSSRWMNYACLSSFLLLMVVIYVPFLDPIFSTMALGWREWLVMAPFFLAASVAAEITKFVLRRRAAARLAAI